MTDSFGSRLAHRRAELGLSLRELGEAAGVSGSQISRYETGKAHPRPKVLRRLLQALGLDALPEQTLKMVPTEPITAKRVEGLVLWDDPEQVQKRRAQLNAEMQELEEADLSDYPGVETRLTVNIGDSEARRRRLEISPVYELERDFLRPESLQQKLVAMLANQVGDLVEIMKSTQLIEINLVFQEPLSKTAKIRRILTQRRISEL